MVYYSKQPNGDFIGPSQQIITRSSIQGFKVEQSNQIFS